MQPIRRICSRWRLFPSNQLCTAAENQQIKIPNKIHRSSTDILKTLAGTVQRDPIAPHYKYHDDPYLIPMSNMGKRTFALAKESGKKAAKWIRNKHSNFFQHRVAEPFIEAYRPSPEFTEDTEVDVNTLKNVIDHALVSDAITVYELLEKKGIEISKEVKQSLLELLCFYNCDEPQPEDLIEEHWFRQVPRAQRRQRKTWKDNGFAEKVFQSITPQDTAAYNTLLQGMIRYNQIDKGWKLYQEMIEKELPLTVECLNSLLRASAYLRDGDDLRWKLVEDLLHCMKKQGLDPTTGTLNSVLEVISTMGNQKSSKGRALLTFSEFNSIGVKPSLASYYYLLIIFCKERGPVSSILVDIMDQIQNQEFVIKDLKDTYFFVTAMDVCRNHLQDKDLAYRVDDLLHFQNNYDLIGDSYKESIYYRHFFVLMCTTEPLEVFMKLYDKLVPHIYTPEPSVMEEVIKVIDSNCAIDLFPRIWSDMIRFDHFDRENLLTCLLVGMNRNEFPKSDEVKLQFAKIGKDMLTRFGNRMEVNKALSWSGKVLGNIMNLCLQGGDFETATLILTKLDKEQHIIVGHPDITCLDLFIDTCIENKNMAKALACLQYSSDCGYMETEAMANKLKERLPMSAADQAKLSSILGVYGSNIVESDNKLKKEYDICIRSGKVCGIQKFVYPSLEENQNNFPTANFDVF